MSRAPRRYAAYMRSADWRVFKLKYYAQHPKVCQGCGSTEKIHLHHHTYDRLGREDNSDVLPLCAICHALVHEHHRQSEPDLTVATFAIVRQLQQAGQGVIVTVLDAGRRTQTTDFVPRHLRAVRTDSHGRLVNQLDWRDECRPWWTQSPHPIDTDAGR